MSAMTPRQKWILAGLGLATLIGVIVYAKRKGTSLGRVRFVPERWTEAPVVDSYSDGNATTTLRSSPDMPIEQRLASIQGLVYKSVQDPMMRKLALEVTSHCPERDGECEAKAVYDFVKQNVRYTGDVAPIKQPDGSIEGIDLYQSARRTLEFGGGDCDDQSIVAATLLSLNGITPRLRVMKERKNDDWSHIFVVAGLPKNEPTHWIAADTTLPGTNKFGVEVPYAEALDFPA